MVDGAYVTAGAAVVPFCSGLGQLTLQLREMQQRGDTADGVAGAAAAGQQQLRVELDGDGDGTDADETRGQMRTLWLLAAVLLRQGLRQRHIHTALEVRRRAAPLMHAHVPVRRAQGPLLPAVTRRLGTVLRLMVGDRMASA